MILSVCFGPPESRPCADRPLVQRVWIVVVTGTGHEDRHAPSERLSGEASRDDPGPPMAGCESASISPLASDQPLGERDRYELGLRAHIELVHRVALHRVA